MLNSASRSIFHTNEDAKQLHAGVLATSIDLTRNEVPGGTVVV